MNDRLRFSFFTLTLICGSVMASAQPKSGYYSSSLLDGKNGRQLELAIRSIVRDHDQISYNDLWDKYPITDMGPADSIPASYQGGRTDLVYDMFAWMNQYPKFYSENNHTQSGGFNREHAVPNSWWGGKPGNSVAYSDLHHVTPADGAANNAKGNYPLGDGVNAKSLQWPKTNTTYMSTANPASHVWEVSSPSSYGGADYVFEPADQYKGDFARMYLYVVCAYETELNWEVNYMFTNDSQGYTTIKPWAIELLLRWHRQDPVSDKERQRNNAVESVQNNRNPFIDYPEFAEYIWGNKKTSAFKLSDAISSYSDDYGNEGDEHETGKKKAEIIFVLHARLGQKFEGLHYSTDSDGLQTYTSSNPDVASVDANTGDITIRKTGRTTITFTIAETAAFKASQGCYIIDVAE
ncbi:MAG: endonuclease [Bacteroidaceae bacterium]|nr:endonuclease [Bacteroidaceae bacterium]